MFSMLIASCPEAQGCMSAVNKYLQQCHAYTSMFMHVFFSLSPDFSSGEETWCEEKKDGIFIQMLVVFFFFGNTELFSDDKK